MGSVQKYLDPMTGRGPFTIRAREAALRPNIFFISADMVPPEFYTSLPGRVRPNTPNLDALRKDSTVFSNAFCTSPLCTPSRASFLTGRFSYITTNSERAHDGHAIHLRENDSIFPEYLKASGYVVRHFGKSHVGTHRFMDVFGENDSPWDRWSPPWQDDDLYRRHLARHGQSGISFERTISGRDPSGRGPGNRYGGWLSGSGDSGFPIEATYPWYLAERATEALPLLPQAGPTYLQLDFFGPHQPFAISAGLEARERELREAVTLPGTYRAILENGFVPPWAEPRIYSLYRKNWGLQDEAAMMDYLVAHILQFEILDRAIGVFLDGLRSYGLYDDSWIVFLSDHGEMNGEWALIDKGAFLNPRVLRVPLYVKSGARSNGTVIDMPVSLVDVAPTLLDAAGLATCERFDGVSLNTLITGHAPTGADARPADKPILAEVWSHVMPNPAVSVVLRMSDGANYLYTFNTTDQQDELYRLEQHAEITNIANLPESKSLITEAVRTLDRTLADDIRFRSYSAFLRLRHAELLENAAGDRQQFV